MGVTDTHIQPLALPARGIIPMIHREQARELEPSALHA
jgi:hypothetical protein